MLRILLALLVSSVALPCAAQTQFLDNGVVRVGVDLLRGGAIAHLSQSGSPRNLVNIHDNGRYVQQSYYSGPDPFVPDGAVQHPAYLGWGWNPVQAGDVYRYPSTTLEWSNDGVELYVKSVPKQWALSDVDAECTIETWLRLDGNRVHLRGRLVNARPDTTRYPARHQELPAVYTIGELYRLFTYTGHAPYTGDALTRIQNAGPPWAYWTSTEQWSALVDDSDFGLGVFTPGAMLTVGGYAGQPGVGGPTNAPTGYIAPLHTELIDHDIEYGFESTLIVGTLDEIRAHAVANRPPVGPWFDFARDRSHCAPRNLDDEAPPYDGAWTLRLDQPDPQIWFPPVHWNAADVPTVVIEAAFRTVDDHAELFFAGPDQGFSGTRRVEVPIVNDGVVRVIEVDLSQHPEYTGTIAKLRFDPVVSAQPGDEVDLMALRTPTSTDVPPATASRPLLTLDPIRPNPFNPRTTIAWSVTHSTSVTIDVIDAVGRRVARLEDRSVDAGSYRTNWNGRDANGEAVASGVYHVRVRAGSSVEVARAVLVR